MAKQRKADLAQKVLLVARQHGVGRVQFRNLVGERLGIHVTDMECLELLFDQGFATPSELARHTGLSSGATTAMLDRLEKSGLIARRPNPKDRRGILIVLTRAAMDRVAPWFKSVRRAQTKLALSYSESELQLITDFFERAIQMWKAERNKIQEKR